MKSTFHELELGQAVIQNATPKGTEQLIVRIGQGNDGEVQVQIKANENGHGTASQSISISQHGLQKLFQWLREEGAVS